MHCIIRAKACKRCGGDLSLECDIYGVYIQCIQCGANWTREDLSQHIAESIEKHARTVKARAAVANGRRV